MPSVSRSSSHFSGPVDVIYLFCIAIAACLLGAGSVSAEPNDGSPKTLPPESFSYQVSNEAASGEVLVPSVGGFRSLGLNPPGENDPEYLGPAVEPLLSVAGTDTLRYDFTSGLEGWHLYSGPSEVQIYYPNSSCVEVWTMTTVPYDFGVTQTAFGGAQTLQYDCNFHGYWYSECNYEWWIKSVVSPDDAAWNGVHRVEARVYKDFTADMWIMIGVKHSGSDMFEYYGWRGPLPDYSWYDFYLNEPFAGAFDDVVAVSIMCGARTAVGPLYVDYVRGIKETPHVSVTPTMLSFSAEANGPLPSAKSFSIQNTGGGTLEWSVSEASSWLSVTPASGTGNSATITVSITDTGLDPGIYGTNITVSSPNADNSPVTLPVTYQVVAQPHITLDPTSLSFSAVQNGTLPLDKTFLVQNTGAGTLEWSAGEASSWLSVSPTSGTGNLAPITVSVTRTDLNPGMYYASVTVSSPNADNSPQTVSIAYEVLGLPHILLGPSSLSFSAVRNGALPADRSFTIFNNTGFGPLEWSVSESSDWLSVAPTSGVGDTSTITVSVTRTNLNPGVHTATITVSSPNADNSPRTLQVSYEVLPEPHIVLTPSSLEFNAVTSGSPPASKTFSINNSGSGTLNWSVSETAAWLSVSPTSGSSNNQSVTVTITQTNLTPARYEADITVSSSNADNSPQFVHVVYDVFAEPQLVVDPTVLDFGRTQPQLSFYIYNAGGSSLAWQIDKSVDWVAVFPVSGTVSSETDEVVVVVDPDGLTPGLHQTVLTVSGGGQSIDVNVSMTVNSPPAFSSVPANQDVTETEEFTATVTATDPNGDALNLYCVSCPDSSSFEDLGGGTGRFTFAPVWSHVDNTYEIVLEASDGMGTGLASFSLHVVNKPLLALFAGASPSLPHDVLVDSVFVVEFSELVNKSTVWQNVTINSQQGDDLYIWSVTDVGNHTEVVIGPGEGSTLFSEQDDVSVTLGTQILDMAGYGLAQPKTLDFKTGVMVSPGDTDEDGLVDERDVLPIGLYFSESGPARDQVPDMTWEEKPAHLFTQGSEWPGSAAAHADADGSGVVDAADVCAIACNWGLQLLGSTSAPVAREGAISRMQLLESSVLASMAEALVNCPDCPGTASLQGVLSNAGGVEAELPTTPTLSQNYPNPFNPSTTIEYSLPDAGHVRVTIYNISGQVVSVLADGQRVAGRHTVVWDGLDSGGRSVSSGVYFYHLTYSGTVLTNAMVLLK